MSESSTEIRFAVCVANEGADDLSLGMIYRALLDEAATEEGLLRIIDDSGEDYLYPATRFVVVGVSDAEWPRLLAASSSNVA